MSTLKVDTIVRGGRVATASEVYEASMAMKGGKIAALAPEELLPEAIDCHVP